VVSTVPRDGDRQGGSSTWVIGAGTEGQAADLNSASELRKKYEVELKARGWL